MTALQQHSLLCTSACSNRNLPSASSLACVVTRYGLHLQVDLSTFNADALMSAEVFADQVGGTPSFVSDHVDAKALEDAL